MLGGRGRCRRRSAPHGVGAGLEAVAGLKLSKGAGLLAAATGKAANDLGNRALRGTGAGSDENALKNAVEDVKHFPYDAVRSGAQVAQAGADLSKFLPHGPREVVGGLAGIPGIAVTALADAQGGKGSAKKGRAIAGSLDDGALGALLGGHPALALKRAGEHPLYTAAEASGAYSAAGRVLGATVRGAGAAGRLAAKGERLRALGDTRRPDLVLEPGARGLRLDRSYSKNLLTALEQKRRDRVDIRKGLGARNKRGEVDGIAFRGSDRARARAMRQAVHEFADTQQNTGRTERETARRSAQTATGRRGESGRQRAQRVLEEGMAELRRRGVDTSGMSGVERAKAAAAMGVKLEQDRGVRARAGRRATAVKSSAKVRAERAVPTKVALPRVPFSAKGGAAWRVRPERELLGAAAKQLIGDVRSSLPQVADKLRSEIDRLEQAYEGSHREMDLPGRRANRNRVGAMKALLHDIETGKRGVEGRVARLMGRGEEYRRVAAGISRAMVQAKLLTPEQAKNAALMDYAVSRFADQGVRHNPERMPTDADAAAYAARKGEAASAGAAARQAGREASQARVESARAGARGTRVAAQRRARKLKPGEKGPERPVLSKSEAKAARKAATEETMRRRAASAELHAIETTGKAAVESAIKEHRAKGLEGEELRAAVEKDPMVVNARTTVQAARKRLGKVAAKTKTERRADALWVRQRVTARKAQEARAAAAQARRESVAGPRSSCAGSSSRTARS
jgi:hypothetical protein